MPVIIKLTNRGGEAYFLNADKIALFYRRDDDDGTWIEYGTSEIVVKETPNEIIVAIVEAIQIIGYEWRKDLYD